MIDPSFLIPLFIISCLTVVVLLIISVARGNKVNTSALKLYILMIVGGIIIGLALALAFSLWGLHS